MSATEPLFLLRAVTKEYRSLRPLRIRDFAVHAGQSLALLGFDLAMAEVFVSLVTGAQLPDAGEVRVFGRATSEIKEHEDWMATLDQFGLISERAVLVEQFTAEQNLAMPLSLEITDMSASLRARVRELAEEVGLTPEELRSPSGSLSRAAKLRLRLGRALALGPKVLLAEHPNAAVEREDAPGFAADYARIIGARRIASVVLTSDRTFAAAVADQVLTLKPATGELQRTGRGWRAWF